MGNKEATSRRNLLLRSVALGSAVAATGSLALAYKERERQSPQINLFPNEYAAYTFSYEEELPKELVLESGTFSTRYTENLLSTLSQEKEMISKEKAANAVLNNLVKIGNPDFETGKMNMRGHGLRLDKSGYILTASHILTDLETWGNENPQLDPELTVVYEPGNKKLLTATHALINYDHDFSILYAPTGKPEEPVAELTISQDFPQNGDTAWIYSYLEHEGRYVYFLSPGKLADTEHYIKGISRADGMVVYPGASGAPIVNSDGRVIGIEHGQIVDDVDGEELPVAATIVQLSEAIKAVDNATVYELLPDNSI